MDFIYWAINFKVFLYKREMILCFCLLSVIRFDDENQIFIMKR